MKLSHLLSLFPLVLTLAITLAYNSIYTYQFFIFSRLLDISARVAAKTLGLPVAGGNHRVIISLERKEEGDPTLSETKIQLIIFPLMSVSVCRQDNYFV